MGYSTTSRWWTWRAWLGGLGILAALSSTGCQMHIGGQTLPSPYYMSDDVQYFPAGPEFKLSREAAALKAALAEESQRRQYPGIADPLSL